MAKGDIVLITFPFTDLLGNKLRPAVILSEAALDFTVCFITTQLQWLKKTDVELIPSTTNGLRKLSILKLNKIATLDKNLAKGLLGKLSIGEISEMNTKLKILFDIP